MELKLHLEKVEDRKKNVSIFCLNVMAHAIWIEYATLSSKKKLNRYSSGERRQHRFIEHNGLFPEKKVNQMNQCVAT